MINVKGEMGKTVSDMCETVDKMGQAEMDGWGHG